MGFPALHKEKLLMISSRQNILAGRHACLLSSNWLKCFKIINSVIHYTVILPGRNNSTSRIPALSFSFIKRSSAEVTTVWLKNPGVRGGGGGNCHLYLQPSSTPWGLLSRWPLWKLSEAHTPFFSTLRINRHWLTLIQPHKGCESCAL